MSIRNAQRVLSEAGHYNGQIDGLVGPRSIAAAEAVRVSAGPDWTGWSESRRVVGAAQHLLDAAGHEPGAIDGYWGHNTQNAFEAWERAQTGQPALVLDRSPVPGHPNGRDRFPTQSDMERVYGPAGGPRCTAGRVKLPFAHKLAWNTSDEIASFRCHELVAPAFQAVFDEAARHYGESEYRRLRLDLFGGCFNNRNMRGGTRKSTHAYGAAVDLDPERNQLRWNRTQASFARAEFVPFWNIVEAQGLVSLGRARDFDWMHFQAARLG